MTPPTRLQNNAPNTRFSREIKWKMEKRRKGQGKEKRAKGNEKKKMRKMKNGGLWLMDMLICWQMNGWMDGDGRRKKKLLMVGKGKIE